jgi:hypothetical protein
LLTLWRYQHVHMFVRSNSVAEFFKSLWRFALLFVLATMDPSMEFGREVERYATFEDCRREYSRTPPAIAVVPMECSPVTDDDGDDGVLKLVREFEAMADLVQTLNTHEVSLPDLQSRASVASQEPAVMTTAPVTPPLPPWHKPRKIAAPSSSHDPQEQPEQQQDHRQDQDWHGGEWQYHPWHARNGSWHDRGWQDWNNDTSSSWGNRAGWNGGREREGISGGRNRVYYAGFYHAKGKGKNAVLRYVELYGEPPAKGTGRCFHERAR